MNTFTIGLDACEFFAFHGIHEFERQQGNKFWVTIAVVVDAKLFEQQHLLENTIDYQQLYQVAAKRMNQPTPLLESLAVWIADDIAEIYSEYISITIEISKHMPPIGGQCKQSKVVFTKKL